MNCPQILSAMQTKFSWSQADELSHQGLGQMQMHINNYGRHIKENFDLTAQVEKQLPAINNKY